MMRKDAPLVTRRGGKRGTRQGSLGPGPSNSNSDDDRSLFWKHISEGDNGDLFDSFIEFRAARTFLNAMKDCGYWDRYCEDQNDSVIFYLSQLDTKKVFKINFEIWSIFKGYALKHSCATYLDVMLDVLKFTGPRTNSRSNPDRQELSADGGVAEVSDGAPPHS
eukprot:5730916-Pyramimonas_sp.AAC.1